MGDLLHARGRETGVNAMNSMKLRLLLMGCILIILGMVFYFTRGEVYALVLPVIGIVLLIGGTIYPNRAKQKEVITK